MWYLWGGGYGILCSLGHKLQLARVPKGVCNNEGVRYTGGVMLL